MCSVPEPSPGPAGTRTRSSASLERCGRGVQAFNHSLWRSRSAHNAAYPAVILLCDTHRAIRAGTFRDEREHACRAGVRDQDTRQHHAQVKGALLLVGASVAPYHTDVTIEPWGPQDRSAVDAWGVAGSLTSEGPAETYIPLGLVHDGHVGIKNALCLSLND